ncbi:MAG: hypothetical protein ACK5B9_15620 [Flavobacteriia bacterium]|jgi:hypothetical protein
MKKLLFIFLTITLFSCMGPDPGQRSEIEHEIEVGECYENLILKNTKEQKIFCDSLKKLDYDTCYIDQKYNKSNCKKYESTYLFNIYVSKKINIKRLSNKKENDIKQNIAKKAYWTCIADSNIYNLISIKVIDLDKDWSNESFYFHNKDKNSKKTIKNFGFKVIKRAKNKYKRIYF